MNVMVSIPDKRWTKPKIARAAFLGGRGCTAVEIAADPLVMSTSGAVYHALSRHGIALRDVPGGTLDITVPNSLLSTLEEAAGRRRLTTEALASMAIRILADDPTLLDNVLDDGG